MTEKTTKTETSKSRLIEATPSVTMAARGPDGKVRRLPRGVPQLVDANDPAMAPFIGTILVPKR